MTFRTASALVHVAGGTGLARNLDRDRCDQERKLLFSSDAPSSRLTVAHKKVHGRRGAAAAGHSSSRRVLEFFVRISDSIKNYRSGRKAAYLEKQEKHAIAEFSNGVHSKKFEKIYQGLKRLHQTKIELDIRPSVGFWNNENYFEDKLKAIVVDVCHDNSRCPTSTSFKLFGDDQTTLENRVSEYSDCNKFFHRMLENLSKIGLISSSYVEARTTRIDTMDKEITESLEKLNAIADNILNNIKIFCSERAPFEEKIRAFNELRDNDLENGERTYFSRDQDHSDVYEIRDEAGKIISKLELGKVNISKIDVSIKKSIEQEIEKLVFNAQNANSSTSGESDFDKDYKRGGGAVYSLNDKPLESADLKYILVNFNEAEVDIMRGICHQGLYPALLDKIVICPAGDSELKYKIFTGENDALSRIEYSIEIDMSKQTELAYNAMKKAAEENRETLKLVKALQVNAVIGVGNGSIALNEFDCTFERF